MASNSNQKIAFKIAQKKLALLWLILCAIIFLLFVFWTFTMFEDKATEYWGWLLPTIMPTLSLIIGIIVSDTHIKAKKEIFVSRFIFRLAFGLSFFYLALILMILILHGELDQPFLETLKNSNLFFGPLQGLVSAAIGAFYYKKE